MRPVHDQREDNYRLFTFQDYWEAGKGVVVPTNCVLDDDGRLVMGAGLAKLVRDFNPVLPLYWATLPLGKAIFGQSNGRRMIRFATKYHYREPSNPELIEKSARSMLALVDNVAWALEVANVFPIFIPKVGCGLGGLDWADQVYPLLDKIIGDDPRFVCEPP